MKHLLALGPRKAAIASVCAALSLLGAGIGPAQSMVVQFDFVGVGNEDSGSIAVTTSGAGPVYEVTGVSGVISDPALSATPFTIQTGSAGLSDYAGSDNLLYWPSDNIVDFGGISFHTNGGAGPDFNIGGFAQSGPFIYVLNNAIQNPMGYGGGVAGDDVIKLGTPSVPEISTWALMILGFASMGLAGIRRSGRQALPFA